MNCIILAKFVQVFHKNRPIVQHPAFARTPLVQQDSAKTWFQGGKEKHKESEGSKYYQEKT